MDTVDDVGAAAVPSMSGSMRTFNKDSVGATIIGCNSNSFVQEQVEVFGSLVVAASSNVNVNAQDIADRTKKAFESAAIIHYNQTTEANFQKNFLEKKAGEILSGNVVGGIGNDKTSEITHGVH